MTKEEFLSMVCDIAAYSLEDTYLDNPYKTAANGDVVYTDEAQDRFNGHLDVIVGILEQYITVEED